MTRNFIKSKSFKRVLGVDLSPSMLKETFRRSINEKIEIPELIRADSSKLPFKSNSIDAIHAGAAMHCWPRLNESLSEIYRVLKPGGVYYASTFFTGQFLQQQQQQSQQQGFYMFKSEDEISSLVSEAGFQKEGGACVVRWEIIIIINNYCF
jgi:ubiquinone/menaquinone biosynthesis C-methylase UbiE